jgi:two-component system nitrate/nitrite response regulator NarL
VIKILIADDHALFREALRLLLQSEPGLQVVGEAGEGSEALSLTAGLCPDILLVDLAMPGVSGVEVLRELSQSQSPVRTILLTAAADSAQVLEAFRLGARGLVLKEAASSVLFKSIRCVMAGEYWVERELLAQWAHAAQQPNGSCDFGLTPREHEVIAEVLAGSTNHDIALKLFISEETVKRHLSNIYDKLGVGNRLELALFALAHDLTPLPHESGTSSSSPP